VLPPASAGSGGGSGTLDVDGDAVVFDAVVFEAVVFEAVVSDAVAVAALDSAGLEAVAAPDVLGVALVLPDVVLAGACGLLKSVHDWVRNVSPLALTLSASAVTV
jgi:hypothetical protein